MENEINTPLPDQQPIQPEPQYAPVTPAPKPKFRPVVLLIALGIAIAGYFASAKYLNLWPFEKSSPIVTYTPTPNQLEDWKIYNNNLRGFSIQYPSDWLVKENGNLTDLYGPNADLASINIKYYSTIKDLPLSPATQKPYDYFNQYVMDIHFFKEQKLMSLNSGTAESAVSARDSSIKVALIGGNGHFYEISSQVRYNQTWPQLERVIQSFKFIEFATTITPTPTKTTLVSQMMSPKETYLKMLSEENNIQTFADLQAFILKNKSETDVAKFQAGQSLLTEDQKNLLVAFYKALSPKSNEITTVQETIIGNIATLNISTTKPGLTGKITMVLENNQWKLQGSESWTQQ